MLYHDEKGKEISSGDVLICDEGKSRKIFSEKVRERLGEPGKYDTATPLSNVFHVHIIFQTLRY